MAKIDTGVYPDIHVVEVSGSPYEMGKLHGKQLADLIQKKANKPVTHVIPQEMTRREYDLLIEDNKSILKKFRPNLFDELQGIAEGANVNIDNVLERFLTRDFPDAPEILTKEDCTAWVACSNVDPESGCMLAQNRDSSYDSGEDRIVILAKPNNAYSYVATGSVGSNDGYGINEKGLAISCPGVTTNSSISAFMEKKPPGIQCYTLARMVLESCDNVADAVEMIKTTPPPFEGHNWMIASKNEIARVERAYTQLNVTHLADGQSEKRELAATNHYPSALMANLIVIWPSSLHEESSRKRYERINDLLSTTKRLDLEIFKKFCKDHHNGPGYLSICNHMKSYGTNMSIISECAKSRLWVLRGNPCLNEYVSYDCPR